MKKIFLPLFIVFIFFGCEEIESSLMKASTGKSGEVLVVVQKNIWKGESGSILRKNLNVDFPGLPQSEPRFSVTNIPHVAFNNIFKNHRNIIFTEVSGKVKKSIITYKYDVYASPQLVITIKAKSKKELKELLKSNIIEITDLIENTELDRLAKNYSRLRNNEIYNQLKKNHDIKLTVPKGYKLDVDTNNFIWISHETPLISQGLLIYYYDYTDTNSFKLDNLLNKRDSILINNVPGPSKNSYMNTDRDYYLEFKEFYKDERYTAEIRGLWNVKGDFMGGPFVNTSVVDEKNSRIITVDAYVYSPKKNKRNYIRQLEAIVGSLE